MINEKNNESDSTFEKTLNYKDIANFNSKLGEIESFLTNKNMVKKTKDNYINLVKIGRQAIEKAKLENLYNTDDEEIAKVIQKKQKTKMKKKLANEEKLENEEKLVNQDKLETEKKLENQDKLKTPDFDKPLAPEALKKQFGVNDRCKILI